MIARVNDAADAVPIHVEYKVWIYRNYIIYYTFTYVLMQSQTRRLNHLPPVTLNLPHSATWVILYYPALVSLIYPGISLLSCVSASSDPQLQELGVQLRILAMFCYAIPRYWLLHPVRCSEAVIYSPVCPFPVP